MRPPLPGWYLTGDGGHIDQDGYLFVMGRIDDVINIAGHRLSTGAMEEVVATHPDVAECAVFGVPDDLRGEVPLGLVVLKAGAGRDPGDLRDELVRLARERIGPVACFRDARVVTRLPKTRSGKILRSTMRDIAAGRDYALPATINDPAIIDEIAVVLHWGAPANRRTGEPANRRTGEPANRRTGEPANRRTGEPKGIASAAGALPNGRCACGRGSRDGAQPRECAARGASASSAGQPERRSCLIRREAEWAFRARSRANAIAASREMRKCNVSMRVPPYFAL
jgi:hypothetical protein